MVTEVLEETEHLLKDVVGGLGHAPAEKAEGERPVAARVGDEEELRGGTRRALCGSKKTLRSAWDWMRPAPPSARGRVSQ